MARGVAHVMGIELVKNFKTPYFATSLQDFWHRWHISLSTWFRDYLYYPLGGSRKGEVRTHLNIIMVFLAAGCGTARSGLMSFGAGCTALAFPCSAWWPAPA